LFAGRKKRGEIELFQAVPTNPIAAWQPGRDAAGSSDRYFQEGEANQDKLVRSVEGRVPYKGSVLAVIHQLMGGLRSSMGYLGCPTSPPCIPRRICRDHFFRYPRVACA